MTAKDYSDSTSITQENVGLKIDPSDKLRILIVRPDRVGDVILSTPVIEALSTHYPGAALTFMARQQVMPLLEGLPHLDSVFIYDPDGKHKGIRGFFRLLSEVRQKRYRIAVVLQSRFKIAMALFFAGVQYRVGPLSKIHSFFFYNRGLRQRRSEVEMHETDYNLQLLRKLGVRVKSRSLETRVQLNDGARAKAKTWLMEQGWKENQCLIAIHAGMGGSALNWPEAHYLELARVLMHEGHTILFTGGPTEGNLLERLKVQLKSMDVPTTGSNAIYYGGKSAHNIDFLAGLLSWVNVAVAPSTGPLHLATALGKPVVSFFPPIQVQSAIRWGPYLAQENRASILVPEVFCGQEFECRGPACHYFPCMRRITVAEAVEEVRLQIRKASSV